MRACSACHEMPRISLIRTETSKSGITFFYKIWCPKYKFGCDEPGVVKLRYDTETMLPITSIHCDDSKLKYFIKCWDHITGGAKEEKEN